MKNIKRLSVILLLSTIMTIGHGSSTVHGGSSSDGESVNTATTMEDLICNVLGFLTGRVGKALAAFACMGVSLAFLAGKVSWTLVLTFSLAMACIFGAPTIIKVFTGAGEAACSSSSS
ncbi:MAG: TrbC/VirB2 family protein [Rickettsiales bacterium]|jgi:type IV secretory pathway VirB2 component (pilin)|nr:TrbC/VirB2 family protein [Rickettsiales bacterium]